MRTYKNSGNSILPRMKQNYEMPTASLVAPMSVEYTLAAQLPIY